MITCKDQINRSNLRGSHPQIIVIFNTYTCPPHVHLNLTNNQREEILNVVDFNPERSLSQNKIPEEASVNKKYNTEYFLKKTSRSNCVQLSFPHAIYNQFNFIYNMFYFHDELRNLLA